MENGWCDDVKDQEAGETVIRYVEDLVKWWLRTKHGIIVNEEDRF